MPLARVCKHLESGFAVFRGVNNKNKHISKSLIKVYIYKIVVVVFVKFKNSATKSVCLELAQLSTLKSE